MSYGQFPAGGDPDDDARLAAATHGSWSVSSGFFAYVDQPHVSPEAQIAGGILDAILGHGMRALEEALRAETSIDVTKRLSFLLDEFPSLAAVYHEGIEAVFSAAGLIASEREVMRIRLEGVSSADIATFTGRSTGGIDNLISHATKALRTLPFDMEVASLGVSPKGGE